MSQQILLGHNHPPSSIELAEATLVEVSQFIAQEPVIINDDLARKAKLFRDRASLALQEMETDRDKQVRPLNEHVKEINLSFKVVSSPLTKALDLLSERMTIFAKVEEQRRLREAAEARRAAEEAERLAREAEQREREALENAEAGEVGVNVVGLSVQANQSFAEFERANRVAARAERDSRVRIGGGFGKVTTLRNVETLVVVDAEKALKAIGLTPDIEDAILKSSRLFRKLRDALPEGVVATYDRKI